MDIYSIINSKAISAHCRKIKHQFTPLETAYLVYANDTMTIEEKHNAFREIITEQTDMEVPGRPWTPHFESLHAFLQTYMDLQNKYLDIFYRDGTDSVYSFEIWYSGNEQHTEDGRIYSTFDECYKAICFDVDDLVGAFRGYGHEISVLDIRVKKQWISKEADSCQKCLVVCIDRHNHPVDIWADRDVIDERDREVLNAFGGMWPEVPTPFEKGDILVERNKCKKAEVPFVLESIPYWEEGALQHFRENGDDSDLCTEIYGQDEDGSIWCDHGPSYLELEYCERELQGSERFLVALGNFLKGNLLLELLLRSYDIFKCERYAKKERFHLNCFREELLEAAGLGNGDEA